jgi:DNA invertase Pin-like site-specific DNA recombinase
MLVGYARTSTVEQVASLDAQAQLFDATGCRRVFQEQVSSVAARGQLNAAIEFVREGDTLVVCKLDRLARSTTDLLNIVATLEGKGVALRILDFGGTDVDTKSATGRMLLTIMAAVAEAERTMMLERQKVGVAKAKAEGRYRGRVPTARRQSARVIELRASGLGPSAIAADLKISRASVYRILCEATA